MRDARIGYYLRERGVEVELAGEDPTHSDAIGVARRRRGWWWSSGIRQCWHRARNESAGPAKESKRRRVDRSDGIRVDSGISPSRGRVHPLTGKARSVGKRKNREEGDAENITRGSTMAPLVWFAIFFLFLIFLVTIGKLYSHNAGNF